MGVDDGGVVVLMVMAGAHVLPLMAMPQIVGHVGMPVLVHLGVMGIMAVGVGHAEPPPRGVWPCLPNPTQVAVQHSPRLTAKLTANPHDNRGQQRTTADGYTRPELRRRGGRRSLDQLTSPRVTALD